MKEGKITESVKWFCGFVGFVPVASLLVVRSFGFLVLVYQTSLSYPVNHHWASSVIKKTKKKTKTT